jgi:predicted ribosomally synthesized peptide with SipW-like signal peptide
MKRRKRKMKTKILLVSILTILLCISVIAGSTYALFADVAQVNIAVTAGDLDITASIEDGKLFTDSVGDDAEFARDGSFANGGSAQVDPQDPSKIIANGMTPGDRIMFNVDVANESNVAVKYRIVWKSNTSTTTVDLADALDVVVTVNNTEQLNMTDRASEYYSVDARGEITTFNVVITFTEDADNDVYQGAMASLTFTVEAVQGNADTTTLVTP